jgi:hypothetical protein
VRWRCTYDMSTIQPGSTLTGGFSSSPAAQQEQCTVRLQYWPRIEAMRGCSAALDTDKLLGENMCSSEAEDLLRINAQEDTQFPMRCVCGNAYKIGCQVLFASVGEAPGKGFLRRCLLSNVVITLVGRTCRKQLTYLGANGDTTRPMQT